ncbi:hypothetical protein GCM10010495_38250 [Kitasatospora herbaricolor]|nr:hypothetical protein [Kitasatospora herbaricolor]GGV19485.1 hypothetical protein GCM10010495_38250 [Kitasatospora herbaricolor]
MSGVLPGVPSTAILLARPEPVGTADAAHGGSEAVRDTTRRAPYTRH